MVVVVGEKSPPDSFRADSDQIGGREHPTRRMVLGGWFDVATYLMSDHTMFLLSNHPDASPVAAFPTALTGHVGLQS